jgi:polysaccharide deacetylase family protein (PEP-CTERM system associated)
MPGAPRFAFHPEGGRGLLEIPVTTVRLFNRNLPAGGGGYFRLLPYSVSRWCLKRVNAVDRQSCMFYFHPWEIDPEQPRFRGVGARTKFRHYLNLHRTEARLRRLLADFAWDRIDRVFPGLRT